MGNYLIIYCFRYTKSEERVLLNSYLNLFFPFLALFFGSRHNKMEIEDPNDVMPPGQPAGIKEIVMNQFNKCALEGSKEMTKRGKKMQVVRGVPMEIDVPDQREVFVNSVVMLKTILAAQIKDSEESKKGLEEISKERKELMGNYKHKYNNLMIVARKRNTAQVQLQQSVDIINSDALESQIPFYREELKVIAILLEELDYFEETSMTSF